MKQMDFTLKPSILRDLEKKSQIIKVDHETTTQYTISPVSGTFFLFFYWKY